MWRSASEREADLVHMKQWMCDHCGLDDSFYAHVTSAAIGAACVSDLAELEAQDFPVSFPRVAVRRLLRLAHEFRADVTSASLPAPAVARAEARADTAASVPLVVPPSAPSSFHTSDQASESPQTTTSVGGTTMRSLVVGFNAPPMPEEEDEAPPDDDDGVVEGPFPIQDVTTGSLAEFADNFKDVDFGDLPWDGVAPTSSTSSGIEATTARTPSSSSQPDSSDSDGAGLEAATEGGLKAASQPSQPQQPPPQPEDPGCDEPNGAAVSTTNDTEAGASTPLETRMTRPVGERMFSGQVYTWGAIPGYNGVAVPRVGPLDEPVVHVVVFAGENLALLTAEGKVAIASATNADVPAQRVLAEHDIQVIGGYGSMLLAVASDFSLHGVPSLPPWQWDPTMKVCQIVSGESHCLMLTLDGVVLAVGPNAQGQLGFGDREGCPSPRVIPGLHSVVHIAAGGHQSGAIIDGGQLFLWGWSALLPPHLLAAVLGDEIRISGCIMQTPVHIERLKEPVQDLALGKYHGLALGRSGHIWSWGKGVHGQLGFAEDVLFSPSRIAAFSGSGAPRIRSVAAGNHHSVALSLAGDCYTWGNGKLGQLGHDDCRSRHAPRKVEALQDAYVCTIVCGATMTFGIRNEQVLQWKEYCADDTKVSAAFVENLFRMAPYLVRQYNTLAHSILRMENPGLKRKRSLWSRAQPKAHFGSLSFSNYAPFHGVEMPMLTEYRDTLLLTNASAYAVTTRVKLLLNDVPGRATMKLLIAPTDVVIGPNSCESLSLKVLCVDEARCRRVAVISVEEGGHYFLPICVNSTSITKVRWPRIRMSALSVSEELIGGGLTGAVFRGRYKGKEVAVKKFKQVTLDEHDRVTADVLQNLTREIKTMAVLKHPNIVAFVGAHTALPSVCLVTEYVPHGSLTDNLHRKLRWPLRMRIARDVAAGMDYIHNCGLLHKDLKSDNILIASLAPSRDDTVVAKVADFGRSQTTATVTSGVGTWAWTAPEILSGAVAAYQGSPTLIDIMQKADVYSFAIVVWQLIERKVKPFPGMQDHALVRHVPSGHRPTLGSAPFPKPSVYAPLVALMQSCWHGDFRERPSFGDIEEALRRIAG